MQNNITREDIEKTKAVLARIREAGRLGGWEECHALMWGHADQIRQYLYSFALVGIDSSFIKPYVDDALARFFNTIDLLSGSSTGNVLEIGSNPYLFTLLLRKFFDFDVTLTNFVGKTIYDKSIGSGQHQLRSEVFDEQHSFKYTSLNIELSDYPFKRESFDKILFCEVLEHVVVDPLKIFPKLHDILKPGGQLIITTPNAVRLINFAHMLAGKNFFDRYHPQNGVYGRHNREFSLSEVVRLLEDEGFAIKVAKTLDRYNYDISEMFVDSYDEQTKLPYTGSQLRELLSSVGANTDDRGDNLYVVAERT